MELGSIFLAALGIGLLIFIHELGHFLAARAAGVRVEVFSLGFGPRLCGVPWKGTDFRLSLVPFGGYVMVAGQDPSDQRYPSQVSLHSKTLGQRALFWSGGVLMNTLFALIVFPLVFHAGVSFLAPVVGTVEFGGAAWEAGLARGERVLAVAGKSMYSFENLAVEVALHGNRPVQLLVRGVDGGERLVTATAHFDAERGLYELGIRPSMAPQAPTLLVVEGGAAQRAGLQTGDTLLSINGVAVLGETFGPALKPLDGTASEPVVVLVRRGTQELAITVAPTVHPEPSPPRIGVAALPRRVLGIRLGDGFTNRLGLQRNDIVLGIDDRPFL
ncbi:MAG TPA: RIP metalloprotease RseP, partial [Planctomycetota bacterium]|nr:RIP metalloprotease RseP [Planctomycetota bacterium]